MVAFVDCVEALVQLDRVAVSRSTPGYGIESPIRSSGALIESNDTLVDGKRMSLKDLQSLSYIRSERRYIGMQSE
jgi:hypothetical protein